jgi:hypothetical protein
MEPSVRSFTTTLGSKVEVYYEDGDRLYGRWWSGSDWIPCKWFTNGKYHEDRECSLDLKLS